LGSKGLKTYPGLPGTDLAVGNSPCAEEARDDDDGFVLDCAVSLLLLGAILEERPEVLSLSTRGCGCGAEATSGGGTD